MADNPKGKRDLVRLEPNERVDLPDLNAIQNNGRSESRMLLHNFVFGHGNMGLLNSTGTAWKGASEGAKVASNPILASGLTDTQTNFTKNALCNSVYVSTDNALKTVTVTMNYWETYTGSTGSALGGGPLTGGFGGVELQSAEKELGTAVGTEGDDSQTLSVSGLTASNYGVYIGSVQDSGETATRIFWNGSTSQEDAQSTDTRRIPGWNMKIADLSTPVPPPHAGYQLIYVFTWDGSVFSNKRYWQNMLFEGIYTSSEPYIYGSGWGEDGTTGASAYGNRSNIRALNGVSCWQDWAGALRSQLRDIIGDAEGTTTYGWWTAAPAFTGAGGSSAWTGERSSLTHSKAHIEAATNPHGTTLTQTDLDVSGTFEVKSTATSTDFNNDNINFHMNSSAGKIEFGSSLLSGQNMEIQQDTAVTAGYITPMHGFELLDNTTKVKADKVLSAQWLITNALGGFPSFGVPAPTTSNFNSSPSKMAYLTSDGENCTYVRMRSADEQTTANFGLATPWTRHEAIEMHLDLNTLFSWASTTYNGQARFVKLEAYCSEDLSSLPAVLQSTTTDQMFTCKYQTRAYNASGFTDVATKTVLWSACPAVGLGTPIVVLEASDFASTADTYMCGRTGLFPWLPPVQHRIKFETHNGGLSTAPSQGGNRIYFILLTYECGMATGG